MEIVSKDLIAAPLKAVPDATVACFDPTTGNLPRRQLDEPRTIDYLQRLDALGLPGALIAASTGGGHLRSVAELSDWFRCAAQAKRQGMMLQALLRPEDGQERNELLLDELAQLGYPLVFFRPGTDLPESASDARVLDQLEPLVAAAAERGLAVGLYSIPDVSGLPLRPDVVASLVSRPGGDHIVAVKVTQADYDSSTLKFLQHPGLVHLKIVQGWDPHIIRALRSQPERCGFTSGTMAFAPVQYQHMRQAVAAADWEEAEAAQLAVTALFQSMQDDPEKFADLQRAKYIMGLGQPLVGEVSLEQVGRVFEALGGLPRAADRNRLAAGLDLMGDGPFHEKLEALKTV